MIIQVEYPKSGGTWLYKMIAYYLNIPFLPLLKTKNCLPKPGEIVDPAKARLEGYDGKNPFSAQSEFGYISQSHALSQNIFFRPKDCTYYLIRDGRDVITSYYLYESFYLKKKDKKPSRIKLLQQTINKGFCFLFPKRRPYSQLIDLKKSTNLFDQYVAIRAREWNHHVSSWLGEKKPVYRYEDLLRHTAKTLGEILRGIGAKINDDLLHRTVELMSFANCQKLENDRDPGSRFYRKGIQGDWRNYFTDRQKEIFKKIAGETLIRLSYEKDLNW